MTQIPRMFFGWMVVFATGSFVFLFFMKSCENVQPASLVIRFSHPVVFRGPLLMLVALNENTVFRLSMEANRPTDRLTFLVPTTQKNTARLFLNEGSRLLGAWNVPVTITPGEQAVVHVPEAKVRVNVDIRGVEHLFTPPHKKVEVAILKTGNPFFVMSRSYRIGGGIPLEFVLYPCEVGTYSVLVKADEKALFAKMFGVSERLASKGKDQHSEQLKSQTISVRLAIDDKINESVHPNYPDHEIELSKLKVVDLWGKE